MGSSDSERKRASEPMQATARHLRQRMTRAEETLWVRLRRRRLGGLKFRRQHAFPFCVVDFYCPAARLVVEVDGPVHAQQQKADANRDAELGKLGVRVLRVSNEQVFADLPGTLEIIEGACRERTQGSSTTDQV